MDFNLTKQEQQTLLNLVRKTITAELKNEPLPNTDLNNEKLTRNAGVFVTLHKHGQLRGCIGYVEAIKPLNEAIQEMALSAAFQDPRFNPVEIDEIDELEIEISVLSPMKICDDIEKIEIGKHGLLIRDGFQSGLLLPQVATEWGYDRNQFLDAACQKAGLPAGTWQTADLYIFSAEIFNEEKTV